MSITYASGEEVRAGDRVCFHGKRGEVRFVVTERVGDPALDWFVVAYPRGGFMISAEGFGNVFIQAGDDDLEDISLVSR